MIKEFINKYIIKNKKISSLCLRKKWFENHGFMNYYDSIFELTSFLPENCQISERIYCIMNDIEEYPKCGVCDKNVKFISFGYGYQQYCGRQCSAKSDKTREKLRVIQNKIWENKNKVNEI